MADITLNSSVRSNLRTLQSTSEIMNRTEERLSTGKKVNSAFDNPGSFFTSQALDRRSSDLTGLLDSVSNSVKTLEAADNGIKAITDVVEGLKATARQALQSPTGAEYSATTAADYAAPTTAATIVFSAGSGTTPKTVNIASGATIDDTIKAINDANAFGITASKDGAKIKIASEQAFLIDSVTGTGNAFAATDDGTLKITDTAAYNKRQGFLEDYNAALKQIDTLAKDSSFNGVNLLKGDDLDIAFNEDGSSKLNVTGVDFASAGVGLSSLTKSVVGTAPAITTAGAFDTNFSINAVIKTLDGAFDKLESQSSKFGSQLAIVNTRQSFTKDMIGTLDDGSAALTSADTNEEAANLATLQTRQSLIVSALSISTSQESNVLQLLR